MNRVRRWGRGVRLAVLLLALASGMLARRPAAAQIPVTDAAHIAVNTYWHYVHYVQFAFQIYQHATQIANQIEQIDNQLRALKKLAHPNWRDIQTLLADLDSLVREGSSIGYSLGNLDDVMRLTFPGWMPWLGPGSAESQAQRSLATMRAGMAAISRQSQSLAPGEATLAAIRQQMTATDGHQMALEQLATLAGFSAQEQLLARQSQAVSANLQAVANAYWINREAQARATFQAVATATGQANFQSTSPGFTFVPAGMP